MQAPKRFRFIRKCICKFYIRKKLDTVGGLFKVNYSKTRFSQNIKLLPSGKEVQTLRKLGKDGVDGVCLVKLGFTLRVA